MTVDQFVRARVLPEYRDIVKQLRALMRKCAPDAQEIISYGIPAFRRNRILAVISPTKKGITFVNQTALRYYIKQAVALDGAPER